MFAYVLHSATVSSRVGCPRIYNKSLNAWRSPSEWFGVKDLNKNPLLHGKSLVIR